MNVYSLLVLELEVQDQDPLGLVLEGTSHFLAFLLCPHMAFPVCTLGGGEREGERESKL